MKITFKKKVDQAEIKLIDFLSQNIDLSKQKIKMVLKNGGVWLKKGNQKKLLRVRRATSMIRKGDYVELNFDPSIKIINIQEIKSIKKTKNWGVWFKPPGVLSQGTKFGDEGSILRFVEKHKDREIFLIQRLDRETSGLMLFAYNKKSAGLFSEMIRNNEIKKSYQAEVKGELKSGKIDIPLDNKKAITHFEYVKKSKNGSYILIKTETGRLHQIRKHFDLLKHPIMGDPKYGIGNKNKEGLKLVATDLDFIDPFTREAVHIELPEALNLF